MADDQGHGTLGVISLGMALGITCAVAVFALGVAASMFGWGVELAQSLSSLYIGFGPSFAGTITGAVWAFVDGLIAGIMIAWLYNKFVMRGRARRRTTSS